MTIVETIDYLKSMKSESQKKSELKIYNEFIAILTDLQNKELEEIKFSEIDKELNRLELKSFSTNKKKFFRKKLCAFKKYLREEHALITEGYHRALGITFGMSFGVGIGLAVGTSINPESGTSVGLSMGIGIGMLIGMMYGAAKDAEAKKQGLVLAIKIK